MEHLSARSLTAIILILIAISLLLLSEGGILQPSQSIMLRPISAMQSWLSLRYHTIRDLIRAPGDLAALRSQNAALETEVGRLQREMIALQEELAKTEILAALLDYAQSQPESRYLAAEVIGKDTSPFLRSIWIGRGSDSGILKGMPVLTERGLVGRVEEVFATSCRIRLITDPDLAVNVRLNNSRAEGLLVPQLSGELWVDLIDQDASVAPGELVLTSGLGSLFPPEIPIGEVISVRRRAFEIFQQAVIQPSVDFDNIEIVLVITNFNPRPLEISP